MIKDTIKDQAALEKVIDYKIGAITATTKRDVGALEKEYAKFRRYERIGYLLIAAAFLLPNSAVFILEVLFVNLTNFWSTIISIAVFLISLLLCSYFSVKFYISGSEVVRRFHAKIDTILFGAVFSIFGLKGELVEHTVVIDRNSVDGTRNKFVELRDILVAHFRSLRESSESDQVLQSLTTSQLINEPFNITHIDNVFTLDVGEKRVMVSELHVEHVATLAKARKKQKIFKGYFVALPLKKAMQGKIFLSTEGSNEDFSFKKYWENLQISDKSLKEKKCAWPESTQALHVLTNTPKECTEVLTSEFLADVHAWWKDHQDCNIRISFIGNLMYVLFPDEQIRFEKTVSHIEPAELKEYMLTIARPLMHILHVIEDVNR